MNTTVVIKEVSLYTVLLIEGEVDVGWVFRLDLFVIQVVSWSQLIDLHTLLGRFHRSNNKISYMSGNSNGKVNKFCNI